MKSVGTADLKAHLSEHLASVRRGETIVVLDRREPIARIVPLESTTSGLAVRPGKAGLQDVRLPATRRRKGDVVADLLDARRERS